MLTYSLTEAKTRHGLIFDQALSEPVQLTKKARPSHVIMSASHYENLLRKLETLEDERWGKLAQQTDATHAAVGADAFTATLTKLIKSDEA